MLKKTIVALYRFNGDIDDVKVVEVEGKQYVDDGSGKPKVDEKGEKILYTPPSIDPAKASLDDLAKANPALAEFIKTANETKTQLDKFLTDNESKDVEDKKKKGEFESLFKAESEKFVQEKKRADELSTRVQKQKESFKKILGIFLPQIPKDKQSLIPEEFGERAKVEYILTNASLLGISLTGQKGSTQIPPNEATPDANAEDKLVREISELMAKKDRTSSEDKLMMEKATALKKLRAEKDGKK